MVQGEVLLKLHIQPQLAAALALRDGNDLDDFTLHEGPKKLPGTLAMQLLRRSSFMTVLDEFQHRAAAIIRTAEHLQEQPVGDLKA